MDRRLRFSSEEENGSTRLGNGNSGSAASSDLRATFSDVRDDVRGFIRMRAVLPLVIHTVLLALILFNLAVARSEEGMDKKVLWSALGFAALIALTALLLYRRSDEVCGVVESGGRTTRSRDGVPARPPRVKIGVAETGTRHH